MTYPVHYTDHGGGVFGADPARVMNYGFDSAGRLRQRKDWVTGEEITYSYDPLGRPSAAATTSSAWGLSWNYDGFGNRLQQSITKGSAPSHSVAVNGPTNQIIGQSYDLNGNLGQASSYNIENRPNKYWYSAANQRLLSKTTTPVLWFHGLDEELLGQFELRSDNGDPAKQYPVLKDGTERIYAGGRLFMMGWQSVSTDRLGSVVRHGTATTKNRAKFATYTRDRDGSDYAWSRQYGAITGRFTTPDPYRASGGPADPASWNRYSYVQNDPVNYNDPRGLTKCLVGVGEGAEWVECEYVTFVIPSFDAHKIREYVDYMQQYASGVGKAKQGLADLAKCDFKSKERCRDFFQALIKAGNLKVDVDTLMDQVISVAGNAQSYVYDGVHSGTQLTAAGFPSTASPGVTTVADWFAVDSGRQALSPYNGYAIFIRPDQWTPHIGPMTEVLSGNVNQYGMGTLMHEILHKSLISGGFSHQTMNDALKAVGMGSTGSLFKNAQSENIGKLCF